MGAGEYASEYLNSLDDLRTQTSVEGVRVGSVRCAGIVEASDAIKVGLLYNDLSLVELFLPDNEHSISIPGPDSEFSKRNPELRLTVPNTILSDLEFAIKNRRVNAGLMMPGGGEVDRLLIDGARLIQAGKLLIRPRRIIMYDTGNRTPQGGTHWSVLEASADAPSGTWNIESSDAVPSERIVTEGAFKAAYSSDKIQQVKCQITIPFIRNVDLSTYTSILQDEGDILVEFRSAISQLAKTALEDERNVAEYVADIVQPRVAKIDRSFRRISASTGMKTAGATVATAALTLASYLSSGSAAALLAFAGGAGAITAVKELADRRDKLAALKDDPLYLLWRMQADAAAGVN